MQTHYHPLLVIFSCVVSVLGSFTALQLAVLIPRAKNNQQRFSAIAAAGAAMGIGAIWATHFIAMLAQDMGMDVTYDVSLTVLSALLAFAGCAIGLMTVSSGSFTWPKLISGGTCMGLGVATAHYTGIMAMMMAATVSYDGLLVTLSIVIAVIASIAALWLAFNLRGRMQMLGSAMAMGFAVCGMHYTGMAAATFDDNGGQLPNNFDSGIPNANLGFTVFAVVATVLMLTLMLYYRRQQYRAAVTI